MDWPATYGCVFSRLRGVRPHAWGWSAKCPSHDDKRSSLAIKIGDTGLLVVKCHANQGCDFGSIARELGLCESDFFPDAGERNMRRGSFDQRIAATYDYLGRNGRLVYQAVRLSHPKDFRQRRPDGSGGWVWNIDGVQQLPYRLPQLCNAPYQRIVFICEGEKDCDRLASLGLIATTNSGGAGKWPHLGNEVFTGRTVCILPDNDEPGERHAADVIAKIDQYADTIRVLRLPGLANKQDVSDWLYYGGTRERLLSLVLSTPTWRVAEIRKLAARLTPDEIAAAANILALPK